MHLLDQIFRQQLKKKLKRSQVPNLFENAVNQTLNPDPETREIMAMIRNLEQDQKKSEEVITQHDFGRGGLIISQKGADSLRTRKVRNLVNLDKLSTSCSLLIHNIVKFHQVENALELGTSLGFTSAYIAAAMKAKGKGKLTTIEGAPEIADLARQNLQKLDVDKYANLITGRFEDILPELLKQTKFDLLFIDGNHRYEPVMQYFNQILPFLNENAIVIVDDLLYPLELIKAWKEIKSHNQISNNMLLLKTGFCQKTGV